MMHPRLDGLDKWLNDLVSRCDEVTRALQNNPDRKEREKLAAELRDISAEMRAVSVDRRALAEELLGKDEPSGLEQ